jgi:hypothetical protein
MAGKQVQKKKYPGLHKFSAGVSLLSFVVIIISGMRAQVGFETIALRAFIVMVAIAFVTRILVKAWASFEELDRG